jgi:hypothetical protein
MDSWLGKLAYIGGAAAIMYSCWLYYAHYWGTYQNFNRSIEFCDLIYCDFTLFYYEQAKVILRSHAPIPMYFYSPTFALLLEPLAHLPLPTALVVWGWVQGLSLLLMVVSGVSLLRPFPWWTHATFLLMTLTSYPILHNWKWGQTSTVAVALAMTSLALSDRTPAPLRTLPLALATAIRYYPAIYGLVLIRAKRWGAFGWFVILSLALLFVLPAVLMGPDATLGFYEASSVASKNAVGGWLEQGYPGSQYMANVLGRVGSSWGLNTPEARQALVVAGYVIVILNLYVGVVRSSYSRQTQAPWIICFVGGCTPLMLPTSWMHYFCYLPFAQTFLLSQLAHSELSAASRSLLLLVVWVPSAALSSVFFFNEVGPHEYYSRSGFLFFSNALMLALAHGLAWHSRRTAVPSFASLQPQGTT